MFFHVNGSREIGKASRLETEKYVEVLGQSRLCKGSSFLAVPPGAAPWPCPGSWGYALNNATKVFPAW